MANQDKLRELYNSERSFLRDELHNLKSCQITFLTSSITATGIILGFGNTLATRSILGIIFLFPLIILLPSWWIFFDKATTITRIVGYQRILEKLILDTHEANKFYGWENALREFRKHKNQNMNKKSSTSLAEKLQNVLYILILRTTHKYWVLSNWVFMMLSGLCIIVSIIILKDFWLYTVPVILLFLVSIIWNTNVVLQLIYGYYSYEHNEKIWGKILDVREKNKNS